MSLVPGKMLVAWARHWDWKLDIDLAMSPVRIIIYNEEEMWLTTLPYRTIAIETIKGTGEPDLRLYV
jgi:hypothetical protein